MWTCIKKAAAGSLGASIAATLVQLFRYPVRLTSMSGISELLLNFGLTFIITTVTVIIAACIWLGKRILRNRQKKS